MLSPLFATFVLSAILGAFAALNASPVVAARAAAPTVTAAGGKFVGTPGDIYPVDKYLGIPFAEPPVGNLRFRLPVGRNTYSGTVDATKYGPSCVQQKVGLPILTGLAKEAVDFIVNGAFGTIFPDSEDCLTLNIVKPQTATATSKLPVVVWIYGGGFELGSSSMYDGGAIVARSIKNKEPVLFVSMNYRVTGYGFLASKEVRAAGVGNLGLHDQREALRWVKKNIGAFGGDPAKVTLWGESAGSISAAMHMVAFDGKTDGLFRGAFMQSGVTIPTGPIENGQVYYDSIVRDTGCTGATDTLQCLRGVPYAKLAAAIDNTPGIFDYQSLRLAWLPREDGVFLTDDPQKLVMAGKVARIPFVTGNCDDEGTLFSIANVNVTTNAQFKTYLKDVFLPGLSSAQVDRIADLYPANPIVGSPFDTGLLNMLSPQSKRLAAFQGDGVFQAPRRHFLKYTADAQPAWSYIYKKLKALPVLGSAHATDLLNSFFLEGDMSDHVLSFVNNLDPNSGGFFSYKWPRYTTSGKQMAEYSDGLIQLSTTTDTYREEQMAYLTEVTLTNPV